MNTIKLTKIAKLFSASAAMEFECLMPHFKKESLISCFHELDGKKAVGIDEIRKEEYGKNLERKIEQLIDKMKTLSYRPKPVREVLIPKAGEKGETK